MDYFEGLRLLVAPPLGYVVALVWGALWGSFFNVCIYRIPVYESVVSPGSRCPHCNTAIAFYDNLPILSWLILRGRCRHCRAPISPRYLMIEALVALLTVALYHRFVAMAVLPWPAALAHFLVYFYFVSTLVVLSGIDYDHQILPDQITYPGIVLFFALGRVMGESTGVSHRDAVIGMIAGYAFVRLVADGYYYLTGREGMGYGDGKLLAMTAGLLGWQSLPFTLLVGSLVGIAVNLPILWWKRKHEQLGKGAPSSLRHVEVPFGPPLAVGAVVYLFVFGDRDFETVLFQLLAGPIT